MVKKVNLNLKKFQARVLIEEIQKEAYKRGYGAGFAVGVKSMPNITLGGKSNYRAREPKKSTPPIKN